MKRILSILATLIPFLGFSQFEFNNAGADIYIQKGALVKVQGTFTNDNGATNGSVKNDGIVELTGDFNNKSNALFDVFNDNTSKDRAVKFVGSGKQTIKGDLNAVNGASFYNLVVDKVSASDTLEMDVPITLQGSLVFGSATTTSTYNPTSVFTNNNQKGLLKTYANDKENLLTIQNGNVDAIAGYSTPAIDNTATTGFIVTQGNRGSAGGGLQRMIASTDKYVYPIGTEVNGYNAVAMSFNNIPGGGGLVKGKFNDGSDNARGYIGSMTPYCSGCNTDNRADNPGYNRYFASNPCNGGDPQWFVLEDAVTDHGYWSFGAASNESDYQYVVEMYPTSFAAQGNTTDTWRTLKYSSAYNVNPTDVNSDWSRDVESVSTIEDLLTYSLNTGSCYTGDGVPGGVYTGFGQFAMKKANSNNALPVKMIYVKAEPNNNTTIDVKFATAVEINNSGFEVKRSTDGVNFTTIGWVNGHNNSTTTQVYNYNDKNVTAGVVYYYQLRQVDNDGASENSTIVYASLTGGAATATVSVGEIMPNPAKDYSHIVMTSSVSQDVTVAIYDMSGRMVSNNVQGVNAGNSSITLDVTALSSGAYTTVIVANGKAFAKNLIVSKN